MHANIYLDLLGKGISSLLQCQFVAWQTVAQTYIGEHTYTHMCGLSDILSSRFAGLRRPCAELACACARTVVSKSGFRRMISELARSLRLFLRVAYARNNFVAFLLRVFVCIKPQARVFGRPSCARACIWTDVIQAMSARQPNKAY